MKLSIWSIPSNIASIIRIERCRKSYWLFALLFITLPYAVNYTKTFPKQTLTFDNKWSSISCFTRMIANCFVLFQYFYSFYLWYAKIKWFEKNKKWLTWIGAYEEDYVILNKGDIIIYEKVISVTSNMQKL